MSFIVGFLEDKFLPLPFFVADGGNIGDGGNIVDGDNIASVIEVDGGGDAASIAAVSKLFLPPPRTPLVFGVTLSSSFSVVSAGVALSSMMVSSTGWEEDTGSGAGRGSVEGRGSEFGLRRRACSLALMSEMRHSSCSQVLQCGQPNMRRSGL